MKDGGMLIWHQKLECVPSDQNKSHVKKSHVTTCLTFLQTQTSMYFK